MDIVVGSVGYPCPYDVSHAASHDVLFDVRELVCRLTERVDALEVRGLELAMRIVALKAENRALRSARQVANSRAIRAMEE